MADESVKPIMGLMLGESLSKVGPNDRVELVMSQCKECGEGGPWTLTVRESGRIVQYNQWDADHNKATKHKKFSQFTLTRENAEIFTL